MQEKTTVFGKTFAAFSTVFWTISTPPDSSNLPVTTSPPSMEMGWLLYKTVFSLLLIIALIIGLVYVLRRYMGQKMPGNLNRDWCQVIARVPLQQKQTLLLVKVLDKVLLLGVTDLNINTLAEFDETPDLQQMIDAANMPGTGFSNTLFRKMMQQKLNQE